MLFGLTENDVPPSGEPLPCVSTGANGICESTAVVDDLQIIPSGQGAPNAVCVTAGTDGVLSSTAAGDDTYGESGGATAILTGTNGVCESAASPNDFQQIAVGQGLPNAPCISTGANGKGDTTAAPGDVQLLGPDFVSLSPNETGIIRIFVGTIRDNAQSDPPPAAGNEGFISGKRITVTHEGGHGTHIEHYAWTTPPPADHLLPSVMAADPVLLTPPLPLGYDETDRLQIRLHLKHP